MKNKTSLYFIVLIAALAFSIILNGALGSANLSIQEVLETLIIGPSNAQSAAGRIFWYARLPRIFACVLAGAALAVSGCIVQSVLGNKLASPSIIGVNAGAGLAVTICCALGLFSGWIIATSSFIGAILAVFLVAFTAQKVGASKTTVILGGVAVNSFLNAISEAISILFPDAGMQAADFRVGGFSAVPYSRVLPAAILIILGILLILSLCNELDIISLGEDTAQGLGLPVKKMRTLFLGIAALLAGAAVSFSGLLGFVGLIVPHVARKFVGNENHKLIPFCALFGSFFVLTCDLVARTLFTPFEIPVGIIISLIGGPFFIFLLLKRRGHAL